MAFENKTKWNNFYEAIWQARFEMVQEIVNGGETHPLRVISVFESMERYSNFSGTLDDIHTALDLEYKLSAGRNIELNAQGSLVFNDVNDLPTGLRAGKLRTFKDEALLMPTLLDRSHINFLIDYLRRREVDAVIELGSGLGSNLVKLFYRGGPNVPYYAGEFTESGTACAEFLGSLSDDLNLSAFRFDYTDPDLSAVERVKTAVVFTCHSIEQVQTVDPSLFACIANVAENVICIHLEPCGWQFAAMTKSETNVDKKQRAFFEQNNWNNNLFPILVQAHNAGTIDFSFFGKNMIESSDAYSATSIAIWNSIPA